MPKVNVTNIASGIADVDVLNANFTALQTAVENTLSRDGTTPNSMSANLDMNGYQIINATATGSTDENFAFIGDWTTGRSYLQNNIVYVTQASDATNGGQTYICLADHTSGTFSTDLAASRWNLLVRKSASANTVPEPANPADDGKVLLASGGSFSWESPVTAEFGDLAVLDTVGTAQITDDAVSLAKMASGTAHNDIRYDGSGNPASVEPEFRVTTNTTHSGTTLTITFTEGYDYQIVLENIVPTTNSQELQLEISTDSGSTAVSNGTTWSGIIDSANPPVRDTAASVTKADVSLGTVSNTGSSWAELWFYNPAATGVTRWKSEWSGDGASSPVHRAASVKGRSVASAQHNAIRIVFSGGSSFTCNYIVRRYRRSAI